MEALLSGGSVAADPCTQAGGARQGHSGRSPVVHPPAPVTTGAESSRPARPSADDRAPALDPEARAGDAPDPLDEQRALDDLDPLVQVASSSSLLATGTAACATIGPVSTPSSTTITVHAGDLDAVRERVPHPVRAGERRQQRGVGVDDPAAERARGTLARTSFMNPASTIRSGENTATVSAIARVPRGAVVEVLEPRRRPSGCPPRARCRAPGCCHGPRPPRPRAPRRRGRVRRPAAPPGSSRHRRRGRRAARLAGGRGGALRASRASRADPTGGARPVRTARPAIAAVRGRECTGEQPVRAPARTVRHRRTTPGRRPAAAAPVWRSRRQAARRRVRTRPPADPEGTARATSLTRLFALLVLASVLVATLPAALAGCRAPVRARGDRRRGPRDRGAPSAPARAGSLPAARRRAGHRPVLDAAPRASQLALWPAQQDKQECLEGALTIAGEERLRDAVRAGPRRPAHLARGAQHRS